VVETVSPEGEVETVSPEGEVETVRLAALVTNDMLSPPLRI
jgi:hypothetical protein